MLCLEPCLCNNKIRLLVNYDIEACFCCNEIKQYQDLKLQVALGEQLYQVGKKVIKLTVVKTINWHLYNKTALGPFGLIGGKEVCWSMHTMGVSLAEYCPNSHRSIKIFCTLSSGFGACRFDRLITSQMTNQLIYLTGYWSRNKDKTYTWNVH